LSDFEAYKETSVGKSVDVCRRRRLAAANSSALLLLLLLLLLVLGRSTDGL
ncbi:unnamed protein product, partial [Rotaria magnacalcarata]